MLTRNAAVVCALLASATAAHAQARITGTWQGHWSRAGDTLPVTLDLRRDTASGGFAATFASDRLRVSGIPFNEVRLEGCCDVTMVLRGDRTTAVFTGRLDGDSLSGTLREETGDGRGIEERYRGREDYLERIRDAADALARQGLLLAEDIEDVVERAGRNWDLKYGVKDQP